MKGGRVPIARSPLVLQSVNDINMGLSLPLYECQLVYLAAMERLGGFEEGGRLKKKGHLSEVSASTSN